MSEAQPSWQDKVPKSNQQYQEIRGQESVSSQTDGNNQNPNQATPIWKAQIPADNQEYQKFLQKKDRLLEYLQIARQMIMVVNSQIKLANDELEQTLNPEKQTGDFGDYLQPSEAEQVNIFLKSEFPDRYTPEQIKDNNEIFSFNFLPEENKQKILTLTYQIENIFQYLESKGLIDGPDIANLFKYVLSKQNRSGTSYSTRSSELGLLSCVLADISTKAISFQDIIDGNANENIGRLKKFLQTLVAFRNKKIIQEDLDEQAKKQIMDLQAKVYELYRLYLGEEIWRLAQLPEIENETDEKSN
jgi:hypothetical protein